MGRLIEYVVAHEVGHTLGFQHNMKASSTYPAEKMRDREWVKKMGHTPTLMDYSRFNYVAQPEDSIDPGRSDSRGSARTTAGRRCGATSRFPARRRRTKRRRRWTSGRAQQDKTPWLRFSTADPRGSDPGEITEAVGDADAVESTALGLKNLERVAEDAADGDDADRASRTMISKRCTAECSASGCSR